MVPVPRPLEATLMKGASPKDLAIRPGVLKAMAWEASATFRV
jgi:hypothetical protein